MMPVHATAEEEAVIEMLQLTGPCCFDDLAREAHPRLLSPRGFELPGFRYTLGASSTPPYDKR
jgi:hypothetical protein